MDYLTPTGMRSPDRPDRSELLYRLSCPANFNFQYHFNFAISPFKLLSIAERVFVYICIIDKLLLDNLFNILKYYIYLNYYSVLLSTLQMHTGPSVIKIRGLIFN